MHINYDAQLKVKSDFVYNNITRIGGYNPDEFLFENIIGADDEYNYRNKAQFPVGIDENGAVCGFYSRKRSCRRRRCRDAESGRYYPRSRARCDASRGHCV